MKKLIIQFLKFISVSGIGWIIDFCIFSILTYLLSVNVTLANVISSFVAIIFVFIVSTKKIFTDSKRFSIKLKFLIYVLYQVVLVLIASIIMGYLSTLIVNLDISLISKFAKIISKILVTPFTMVLNYIVMKYLIERM